MPKYYHSTAPWMSVAVCAGSVLYTAACPAGPQADAPPAGATEFSLLPRAALPAALRDAERYFPTRIIKRGSTVYPLPRARTPLAAVTYVIDEKTWNLDDFFARNRVAGLLVLKDGQIVLERYGLGNSERSRWSSFAIGKSIVSTLVGAAVKDGLIESIENSLPTYLPQLYGSAYERTSIRHLLQMSSGVKWNENYGAGDSDVGMLTRCAASRTADCIIDYMGKLPRAAPPGTLFNYNSGETHLLGMAVMSATHKTLSGYLSERIWSRFGMESDAYWTLESDNGVELGGGTLAMTLRDYGRFGEFIRRGGEAAGARILPAGWLAQATQPRADSPQVGFGRLRDGDPLGYGYQWWVMPHESPHGGAFQAEGIFGQYLYINPPAHLVVVVWSAWPQAWVERSDLETVQFMGGVLDALTTH